MTAKFLSQMPDLWRWHLHQLDVGRQKMTCNYRTKHDSNDKMFLLKMYAITWTTWDTSHRQKATRVKDIQCDFITTVKFIFSEKATKFCEISTLLLSVCTVDKSKVEISQKYVAFSEYMNVKRREKPDKLPKKYHAWIGRLYD